MFFDSVDEVAKIAGRESTAIFVMPSDKALKIKNAIVLQPEDKSVITIEQARDVMSRLTVRQTSDVFVVIRPAEMLGEEAANALLKSLEEPGEKVHFVLVTSSLSSILPTIRSRSAVYVLRLPYDVRGGINVDEKTKELAKRLMVAKPIDLPALAEEITKKKEGVRAYALSVLGAAIEMLYKSYFITGKEAFVRKLPKFLSCYEAIAANGHVKLHIVADLM